MQEVKIKIQSNFDQKKLHYFSIIVNVDKDINHK